MAKRAAKHSEHRALALLRSEKYSRTTGAPCVVNLDRQTHLTALWAHQWRIDKCTDQDIWTYITMRWPHLSQEDKHRIFHGAEGRAYRPYVAPVDRFIIVNKANMRKNG